MVLRGSLDYFLYVILMNKQEPDGLLIKRAVTPKEN